MEPTSTFVDTSVLLDVLTDDPSWSGWSREHLAEAADRGGLVINPIVYAEASIRFTRIEDLEEALSPTLFQREGLPGEAAFLAAKAHQDHRRRGGSRQSALPDFFIGAHAAVRGYALLTRDPRRVRQAFPRLRLIAPG